MVLDCGSENTKYFRLMISIRLHFSDSVYLLYIQSYPIMHHLPNIGFFEVRQIRSPAVHMLELAHSLTGVASMEPSIHELSRNKFIAVNRIKSKQTPGLKLKQ